MQVSTFWTVGRNRCSVDRGHRLDTFGKRRGPAEEITQRMFIIDSEPDDATVAPSVRVVSGSARMRGDG
jgi:hypothetical protein